MSFALLASLIALAIGPLVFERTKGPWTLAALDAFALVAVGGLVSAHILPQSFAVAGWWAAPVLFLGLFGPGLLCGSRLLASAGSRITLPFALLGIALHAVLDGVALAAGPPELSALGLAIVLHRVSDGLGIWWLARPAYGRRVALILLGTLAAATVVGFLMPGIEGSASHTWFALLQALIAGSLLHVILRHPPSAPRADATPRRGTALASGIGGLLGLALVLALEGIVAESADHAHGSGALFLELALRSAPALLAAYALVALLSAWGLDLRRLLGRGPALVQTLRGTLVGLPMPICSCGVIPLYRSLVQQGVPARAALAFLVSAPEISVPAVFLSVSLLGLEITAARALAAFALALGIGLVVGARAPAHRTQHALDAARPHAPLSARVAGGLRYGFGDMVDATAPWILVGLGVAALVEPLLSAEDLARLAPGLEVPLFALLGMPLYVCASGSTPLAAVLIAEGVSPGAAIAFLLTGPATNITTFGVLSRLHSRGTALAFAGLTALGATVLGIGANAVLAGGAAALPIDVHGHGASTLELASAVALLALFVASLLRQGTRRFVAQVTAPHGAESHAGHDHDHGHEDPGRGASAHAHGCCEAPAAKA